MAEKTVADELAERHKVISVAEFFEKNRHLLGFDSGVKAMLTCVKEAVDNSLDAVEEYSHELKKKKKKPVVPDILVRIDEEEEDVYRIIVQDNGPGIIPKIIPRVFGKMLYGSKFHRLKQGRGQQGIGISAAVLYSQLTTGKPVKIISRTDPNKRPWIVELIIDTRSNEPKVIRKEEYARFNNGTGTRVELIIEGTYYDTGSKSVREYLKRTSIVNPHSRLVFIDPDGNKSVFKRVTKTNPRSPQEIKPHPWGMELGILTRMLEKTDRRTILSFLTNDFTRVGSTSAKSMLEMSKIDPRRKPDTLTLEESKDLLKSMNKVDLQRPPVDCLSPVGDVAIEKSLKMEYNPEFIAAVTRAPNVYRGYPFQVEAALAYGGDIPKKSVDVIRIANKVPLLYEKGACAVTKAVKEVDWGRYGLKESSGGLPDEPLIILVHICSVWVPFTSESKSAVATYPVIVKDMKLGLQECGRKLKTYVRKKNRIKRKAKRVNTFVKYSPEMINALSSILSKDVKKVEKIVEKTINNRYGDAIKKAKKVKEREKQGK